MFDESHKLGMRLARSAAVACAMIVLSHALFAQPPYQPSPENVKSREWFQQARFGMFIHWGIYSLLGDGEWVMQEHHLTGPQYGNWRRSFTQ
jgi:alpha-L-fucosidase